MNLNYETILDFYTFKGRKFLCQIKVNPKSKKFKNTCRSLSQEQWATFDKKLEKLLTANDELDEKGTKFKLNPSIVVKVQKSKLRIKHYSKLLEKINEFNGKNALDFKEQNFVLECQIEFQQEVSSSASSEKQEYNPNVNMSPNAKVCSSLSYEPYIPSMKRLREQKIDIIKSKDIEWNEDTYSPKPLVGICINDPNFPPAIPQYTPAPINDRRKSKESRQLNFLKETDNEVNSSAKQTLKISSNKKYKKMECEYIPKSQDVSTLNVPIYIPTPIEATRDTIKKNRKRSNTIDAFTDLADENDDEKQTLKTKQQPYIENLKYQSHNKSLKKRSMTIDEIPTELSGMPVYVPTPLEECVLQNVFKTCDLKKGKESPSLEDVKFHENAKENQFCDESVPHVIGSLLRKDAGHSLINSLSPTTILSTGDVFKLENAFTNQEIPAALENFNRFQKSEDIKQFPTGAEESLPIKYDMNNLITKSVSAECKTIDKNIIKGQSEVPEEDQACIKHIEHKRLPNSLSTSDMHNLKSFRRNRIENNGTEATQTCRLSERSSNIPKSLNEEQLNSVNKISGKRKPSLKNKDLFGTDDEDDDELRFENNNNIKMSLKPCESSARKCTNKSSSSKKKRHKKEKSIEIYEKK